MSQTDDLSFVATTALIDELFKRHDCCLVVANKDIDKTRDSTLLLWKGGRVHMLGLAQYAIERANAHFVAQELLERAEEDED